MGFVIVLSQCRCTTGGSSRKELIQAKSNDTFIWQYRIYYWVIDRGSDFAII